jgi:hypothetical protein
VKRFSQVSHIATRRLDQAGNNPQQRRLARARTAQQADDLAFEQRHVHIAEDEQVALRLAETATHVFDAKNLFANARRHLKRRDV